MCVCVCVCLSVCERERERDGERERARERDTLDLADVALALEKAPVPNALEAHVPLLHHPPHLSYKGTSLIRNSNPLGPYSRTMPRGLW